jgi:transposase
VRGFDLQLAKPVQTRALLGRRRSTCHLLAEIGEARRFRRAQQIMRLAGLDPVVDESGETRRRGKLAKAGSPHLGWALGRGRRARPSLDRARSAALPDDPGTPRRNRGE